MGNLNRALVNARRIVIVAMLVFGSSSPFAQAPAKRTTPAVAPVATSNAAETVYGTKTGTKYHRAACRHLRSSQIPMTLKAAVERYSACSVCRPPTLSTSAAAPVAGAAPRSATQAPARAAATSSRCQATTQKGAQCKRTASAGSTYCWQHGLSH